MPREVRLRGNPPYGPEQPYRLNEFPEEVIQSLCSRIVYWAAVGHADIDGDAFSRMYAETIDAQALARPVGVADVVWRKCAWSIKTIKDTAPHDRQATRLISGRCSPDYSAGISDPRKDVQATGQAVLDIYNERIHQARAEHDIIRLLVLIRNMSSFEFALFERDLSPVPVNNYRWRINRRDNFEGYEGDRHCFTWQPHGSQLTVIESVPASACRFRIRQRPDALEMQRVLSMVRFSLEWVEILSRPRGGE